MRKYLIIVLFFIAVSSQAQQNNTESFSFSVQQAIDYAVQHNSAVQNATLDEELNKRKVQEFTGTGFPQITAGAQASYSPNVQTTFLSDFITPSIYNVLYNENLVASVPNKSNSLMPVQFGAKYSLGGAVNATQLLFDGRFFVGLRAQKAVLALTQKNTERTKTEISVTVAKAYYNVLITEKRLSLLNTNVDQVKKSYDDIKAYYQNGLVEKLDQDRLSVTYNNLLVEKDNITKLAELSKMLLKFQMGMDVNANLQLTDSLHDDNFESVLQQETFDPQNRVEYQLLQSTKTLYGLQKKVDQYGFLPGLYASGSYGYNGSSNSFNFFDKPTTTIIGGQEVKIKRLYPSSSIGLQLSVPIFDGFQKMRRIQQANINMLKTDNDMANLKNAINLEVNQSKIMLMNSNASLKIQKDNMELSKQVYNTSKIKFDQGVGSSLELTNASAGMKESETNYLNALYDAWVAKIDYQKATGQFK